MCQCAERDNMDTSVIRHFVQEVSHVCTCVCVCTCVYVYVCVYMYMYDVYLYVCMYTCVYVYVCACILYLCPCMHVDTYVSAYIYRCVLSVLNYLYDLFSPIRYWVLLLRHFLTSLRLPLSLYCVMRRSCSHYVQPVMKRKPSTHSSVSSLYGA